MKKRTEFINRTGKFAFDIIIMTSDLQQTTVNQVIGRQLLRSATSVGANVRSATRARSRADFISKINIAEEEADESIYWLELLLKTESASKDLLTQLIQEAEEILSICVTSGKTAKANAKKQ